ncbi:MAG: hypothetical protein LC734_09115, partial [Acidobacteria bacterium]|nr:hypothetical protein [Acidobacteriota bacterium]
GDEGDNLPLPDVGLLESNDTPCVDSIFANHCNVLAPAYIRPMYDLPGSGDEVPYSEYLGDDTEVTALINAYFNNKVTEARDDFWTAYLLSAYQYQYDHDGDPDYMNSFFPAITGMSNVFGAVIFLELCRGREYDYMNKNTTILKWQQRPVTRRHILAHEVGHLFGGEHEDNDPGEGNAGLMDESEKRMRGVFGDTTISKIRQHLNPGRGL